VVPRLDDSGEPLIDEDGNPVMVGKYIGLHDFRHFFASWLIKFMKADPKLVQTYMGHSTIRMTYDIYGHLFQMTNPKFLFVEALESGFLRVRRCFLAPM
jgi:integrase